MIMQFAISGTYGDRRFNDAIYSCREQASNEIMDIVLNVPIGRRAKASGNRRKLYQQITTNNTPLELTTTFTPKYITQIPIAKIQMLLNELRIHFPSVHWNMRCWRGNNGFNSLFNVQITLSGDLYTYHAWWWMVLILRAILSCSESTAEQIQNVYQLLLLEDYQDTVALWGNIKQLAKRDPAWMIIRGQGPSDLREHFDVYA